MNTFNLRQCLLLFSLLFPMVINAQFYMWTIVTKNIGKDMPEVTDYRSTPETAGNGVEYVRIIKHQQLSNQLWNWVPQQYGMREADGKLYVYDFENEKELIAFDFNLSVGDEFTTLNGMLWQVEEVGDTLINDIGLSDYDRKHRLLKVQSKDGKWTDQWIEGIGSFSNHLMTMDMSELEFSHMPWFMYDFGEYMARELSCDPIFGHDTGWMAGHYDDNLKDQPCQTVSFKDGTLTFTDYGLWWPARYYTLYYRDGDNIYVLDSWEFLPHVDSGEAFWATDKVDFKGLPAPASGSYTLHIGNTAISTQIQCINPSNTHAGPYDLQGRRYTSFPFRGVFIKDGKKVVWK